MSYLLDFVKSFDETELKQFRNLDLVGKEESVRNEYANHARDKDVDESRLHTKLRLSKSHFDKINSVLLDKALTYFAGNDLKEKLDFLTDKQLSDLVLHELKHTEKRLKKQKDKKVLKEFYAIAFRTCTLFNYNKFPVREIDYYCQCYVQLLGKLEQGERYRILAKQEEVLMRYYYSRKDGTAKRGASLKKLLKWQAEIKSKNFFEAEAGINLGISSYYETFDPGKGLHYLQLSDTAARKVYDKISDRDKAFLLAMMASHLLDLSRYKECVIKYQELFSTFPHLAGVRIFHPFSYAFVLLIEKDFKTTSTVMEKYLQPFLKNENARNYHFDVLRMYAIFHLLNGETEKAGNYLQQILQFGKEEFTPLGDVLFRLVHNVYCVQTGDYVLAADVLKKNIKYMDSKLSIEGMDAYKKMFLDLGKVIRFKSRGGLVKQSSSVENIAVGEGRARLYQDLVKLPLQQ